MYTLPVSYICYLCLFAQWLYEYHDGCLIRSRHCLLFACIRVHPRFFVLLILLVFLSCVICFVCLRVVSCVPNVGSVFELSILGFLFGFLQGVTNPSKLICSRSSYLCLLSRETANTSWFFFRCIRTMIGQSHCYTTMAIMIGQSHCYTTTAIMIGQSHCYTTMAIMIGQSHCYTTTAIMIGQSHCYTTTAIMIGQSHCYTTTSLKSDDMCK
jgi:hypothetical protein